MTKFGNSELSNKPTYYYNLDMIISVGYRVKSKKGIEFRKWANKILTVLTLLIAESNPKEKELLIDLVMIFKKVKKSLDF